MMIKEKIDRSDVYFMTFLGLLSCGIATLIAWDFIDILTDLWCGFGGVMMEFGSVIEQLPV